jgi:hypothetical protein
VLRAETEHFVKDVLAAWILERELARRLRWIAEQFVERAQKFAH